MANLRPYVILKVAVSLNGCIDDGKPVMLSDKDDLARIDSLRSVVDAILVGAGTVRNDDPRLLVKDPILISERLRMGKSAHPTRVVLSRIGDLPSSSFLFQDTSAKTIVFAEIGSLFSKPASHVEVVYYEKGESIQAVLSELLARGVGTLLVEGGAEILSAFCKTGSFDAFRLAYSASSTRNPEATFLSIVSDSLSGVRPIVRCVKGMEVVWFVKNELDDVLIVDL